MNPDRWQRIDEIFQAVLSQSPEKRESFLAKACGGDAELFREVASLIAHHGRSAMSWERLTSDYGAGLMSVPQTVAATGRRIGPYQILNLIGAGGMGEVYLAEDTTLGRRVALKLLPARFTKDTDRVLRFEMEARAASALNHPNIVTIHQIGQIDGTHFIVTEFIEGQTLRRRIKNAPMPLPEVLDVANQVALALGSAHAAGIVHRDIKPENVIQRPDGLVKVLDFGLAKLSEELVPVGDENAPRVGIHTESGVVMGTTRYMSPEQARGQRLDARTDIFSLGVVLYEMVSGCPPFAGATASDVLAAILKEEPPPLSHYSAAVPAELERIVRKTLAKELNERYSTSRDLQLDLKRLQQNLELQAKFGPPGPVDLKRPLPVSRRRAIWLASVAAAAATTGFATWRFWPHGAGIRSLAVLPFVNVAKDEDVEYLCDGITETLITKIHQLPLLEVKAFSLVLNFKGKILDPR
jgi:serine/threonine protein kinase